MAGMPTERPRTPLWLTVVIGVLAVLGIIWVFDLVFSIAFGLLKAVIVLLGVVVVGYLVFNFLLGGGRDR
jgi:hypothetical protein